MRILILTIAFCLTSVCAYAEKRIALVIGNGGYQYSPLPNPPNDADLMAETLTEVGFDVTKYKDLDRRSMRRAFYDFGIKVKNAGQDTVALVYYAGHGVQVLGENYLLPVGGLIESEFDVQGEGVSASEVLQWLPSSNNALNIVILDACRNNPFKGSSRAATRGLAKMDAPTGTLLAFSTAPGSVAKDGTGKNSPYTLALSRAILKQGAKVEEVFKTVRVNVMDRTQSEQVPWESSSLVGDFYFSGKQNTDPSEVAAGDDASSLVVADKEVVFWRSIQNSTSITDYEAYLHSYPDGAFVALANARIEMLDDQDSAPLEPSPSQPKDPTYEILEIDETRWTVKRSNVRTGPATTFKKLALLEPGTEVEVVGKVEGTNWLQITVSEERYGYIFAPLLSLDKPSLGHKSKLQGEQASSSAKAEVAKTLDSASLANKRSAEIKAYLNPTRRAALQSLFTLYDESAREKESIINNSLVPYLMAKVHGAIATLKWLESGPSSQAFRNGGYEGISKYLAENGDLSNAIQIAGKSSDAVTSQAYRSVVWGYADYTEKANAPFLSAANDLNALLDEFSDLTLRADTKLFIANRLLEEGANIEALRIVQALAGEYDPFVYGDGQLWYFRQIGMTLIKLGDETNALLLAERAENIVDHTDRAWDKKYQIQRLASIFYLSGNIKKALALAEEAKSIEENPEDYDEVIGQIASDLSHHGNWQKALELLGTITNPTSRFRAVWLMSSIWNPSDIQRKNAKKLIIDIGLPTVLQEEDISTRVNWFSTLGETAAYMELFDLAKSIAGKIPGGSEYDENERKQGIWSIIAQKLANRGELKKAEDALGRARSFSASTTSIHLASAASIVGNLGEAVLIARKQDDPSYFAGFAASGYSQHLDLVVDGVARQ